MWTGHHAPDIQLVANMEFSYQISLERYAADTAGALGTDFGPPTLGHMYQDLGAYGGAMDLADAQIATLSGLNEAGIR